MYIFPYVRSEAYTGIPYTYTYIYAVGTIYLVPKLHSPAFLQQGNEIRDYQSEVECAHTPY